MRKKRQKQVNKWATGGMEIFLLILIAAIAFFLVGGFGKIQKSTPPPAAVGSDSSGYCCDTGNGADCKVTDKRFTWKGTNSSAQEYGLIKSNIKLLEGAGHIAIAPPPDESTPDGNPIYLNSTNDTYPGGYPPHSGWDTSSCHGPNQDFYFGSAYGDSNFICVGLPNDEIIFVCRDNCAGGLASGSFDAYFRISDGEIPDLIKNCKKSAATQSMTVGTSGNLKPQSQKIVFPNESQHDNLQLDTFKVENPNTTTITSWLSPFCKPAIYLYPEKETQVSVQVHPAGKFTYTNPLYPQNGWTVTASPDGSITSSSKLFPYLYYEADIPSLLIEKPQNGYVVSKDKIKMFLSNLLPELGLNEKESSEMSTYWGTALPASPYYFIGIIPENTLESIAPLSILPQPSTVIRISLYFQPLEQEITVSPPVITPRTRNGFTVVEWGGVVKTDKQFMCLQ